MFCLSFYMFHCVVAATPPNSCTPVGTPRGAREVVVPLFCGNLDEAIRAFLKPLCCVDFTLIEHDSRVPGRNHLKTGEITFKDEARWPLFILQRRFVDYRNNPPVCAVDLSCQTGLLVDRMASVQRVLEETGVVPLLARFLQQELSDKCYVELYPFVNGCAGDLCIKTLLKEKNEEEVYRIVYQMGRQTGRMFNLDMPHADCHPGNFLVTKDGRVFAIDCRGPLRSLNRNEPTPPAIFFITMLTKLIYKAESDDQQGQKSFVIYRDAFLKGMQAVLQGNCLYGFRDSMPFAEDIIAKTNYPPVDSDSD